MKNKTFMAHVFLALIFGAYPNFVLASGKTSGVTRHHAQIVKPNKAFAYQGASIKAMPLPLSKKRPRFNLGSQIQHPGQPGSSNSFSGNGKGNLRALGPVTIVAPPKPEDPAIIPLEFGTASHPYNTHRVDNRKNRNNVSRHRPYRSVGQLFFTDGGTSFLCSAALIKRGIIVTAAHCVAEFGASRFFSDWQFIPAAFDDTAPFGIWDIQEAYVMTSYFDGTDDCAVSGVVCTNDMAVLAAIPQSGSYPGDSTGWLRFGWNGNGFTDDNLALISQLGYPSSHDQGKRMQQSDSQAFVDTGLSNNIIFGGRQTGGSSGGPLLVNLGRLGELDQEAELGDGERRNMVVGVVSWGYFEQTIKQQGASPFTSDNILKLVRKACKDFPEACQSKQ